MHQKIGLLAGLSFLFLTGGFIVFSQTPPIMTSNGFEISDDQMLMLSPANYNARLKHDPTLQWKFPILFYGRVLDQDGAPVAGATAHCTWSVAINPKFPRGEDSAKILSDANGCFTLTNRHGKELKITVAKDGYHTYPSEKNCAYEYAQPETRFHPEEMYPVTFHLRKKGPGTDLITAATGMSTEFQVRVPRDGKPVLADLEHHSQIGAGQVQFSQVKPAPGSWSPSDWSFKITVPNGGVMPDNDLFPFEAPETGYDTSMEFRFQKDQPTWLSDLSTNLYIKYGTPPRYGWLHIQTSMGDGNAALTYGINPTGGRNLEPK